MEGRRPCPEFLRFTARTGGLLLSGEAGAGMARRAAALAGRVAADGCAAVVTSGEDVGIPLALALWLRRSRAAVLMQVHGHYLDGRKFALLAPLLRRLPRLHLLCLSEALRDRLVGEHGFDPARCRSVGYGVDTGFFDPARHPAPAVDGPPLLLAAGQANRDWTTLIEAVRGLPVRLRVAAASPWMDAPERAPAGLPPNVEFRPADGYEGLRALYAEARAVVVPMHPAGHACGYAVMAEAMAMGRPLVVTRLAAPSDFFRDGEHGAAVPPHDVPALRAALLRLVEDPPLAARQGAAARRQMEEGFGLDAFCERLQGLGEDG